MLIRNSEWVGLGWASQKLARIEIGYIIPARFDLRLEMG